MSISSVLQVDSYKNSWTTLSVIERQLIVWWFKSSS